MTILVTGASGQLGRLTLTALQARGVAPADIRAGARRPSAVADLGVPVVELDYDRPETAAAAMAGVDEVLLISASEPGKRVPQHAAVIDAARDAGVRRIVYTSAPRATTSSLVLAPEHKATEELILASGIPFTFLRNNWYTENYASTLEQAKASGVVISSTGEGRVASASRPDFADAAAAVLTSDGHEGETYELGGDVAWTHAELASTIARLIGSEVVHRSVSPEEHLAILTGAGLDADTAGFVVALDGNIRDGVLAEVTGDMSRLTGRPTTPLIDGLRSTV
jgi:NAD(P)H dehydrogenase (quinone)